MSTGYLGAEERERRNEPEDPLIEMPEEKLDYDLNTFFPLFSSYIYGLCNDRTSLIYNTNAVLADFHDDGVVYLELRTTPRAMPSESMTKADYVQEILDCISASNKSTQMKMNLILSIDRRNDPSTALEVVELSIMFRNQSVVGIDLCDDPAKGNVSTFRPAFEEARRRGLKITIHFAESPKATTPD